VTPHEPSPTTQQTSPHRPQYDPYHTSNTHAQAGPSGLRSQLSPTSDIVVPDSEDDGASPTVSLHASPAEGLAASSASVASRLQSAHPPPAQLTAKRPKLLVDSDSEEERELDRRTKKLRGALRHDRWHEIGRQNAKAVREQEREGDQRNGKAAHKAKEKEERDGKAGVVEQIDLTNIMVGYGLFSSVARPLLTCDPSSQCHPLFSVSFKPGVNFVTGNNGSMSNHLAKSILAS
jgi:hypothetical protein